MRYEIFRVKLGIPWLVTMNTIPLVVHKFLKFIHKGTMHVVHYTVYKLPIAPSGSLPLRTNLLY